MSWDVSMVIDAGGTELATIEEVRNVTYNNGRIFSALGVHPEGKEKLTGAEWMPLIEKALEDIYKRPVELEAFEPSNGWGGIEDSQAFLQRLLTCCMAYPKATVRWS